VIPGNLDSALDRSPAAQLRFFDLYGYLPFSISGGSPAGDDGGEEEEGGEEQQQDSSKGGKGKDQGKDDSGGEDDDRETLNKALAEERTARKKLEKTIRDLTKQVNDAKNAGKPENEQLQSKLDQAETDKADALTKLQEKSGRAAVIEAAVKAGSPKPDLVYRLVKDALDFDDDADVTNLTTVMAEARKDAPELFRSSTGKGNGGSRDESDRKSGSGSMNSWIRQAAGVREE
jgi:hypothetical protein